MPSAASLGLVAHLFFQVVGQNPGAWPDALSCAGFQTGGTPSIIVLRDAAGPAPQWIERLEGGAILILEGESATGVGPRLPGDSEARPRAKHRGSAHTKAEASSGSRPTEAPVFRRRPKLRCSRASDGTAPPLVAGMRRGKGAVLWVATGPGTRGYDRYPYLLQALSDLGSRRRSAPRGCGPSSIPPTASASTSTISPASGAPPASRLSMSPPGTTGSPTPQRDAYLGADRRLPPQRDPGLCVARIAARQRAVLERASRMAREDRHRPGCAPRLAQAHEPHQSRVRSARCRGTARPDSRASIGTDVNLAELYFESSKAAREPLALHADERRRARVNSRPQRDSIAIFQPGSRAIAARPAECAWASFSTTAPTSPGSYRNGVARRTRSHARESNPASTSSLTHVDDRFDTDACATRSAPMPRALLPASPPARLHLPHRGPRHHLEPRPAALHARSPAATSRTLTRPGPARDRHQHRRALPGRLSDQAADRNGTAPARSLGFEGVSPRGAVLRELDSHARPAAAFRRRRRR